MRSSLPRTPGRRGTLFLARTCATRGDAWQRFFELKQAQFVEEFGNADLLPDDAPPDVRFADAATAEDFEALDPARLVGTSGINLPLVANTTSADLHVWIDPACRGRGLGSAIIATASASLVDDGRTRLTA
ncbi:GNAT family N-acetyltransferase [Bowdeniella nasicola]|uniref:GNAT family N-acetyltransferase n=1 Tax=Bowdeniella nasicola TaxID=208480 RepID=UPI001C9E7221|nr:GNAT family N-acetyltransferase [Bowdeniella nasicola]